MLAKSPDRRPTAREVADRLAALLPGLAAGGPVRNRRELLDTPTGVVAAPGVARSPLRCTVLCASTREPPPREVADRFAGEAESLVMFDDGTLAADLVGEDPATALRAAALALKLRDALPDCIVVITCDVDRGARALTTAVLESIFGSPDGAIYVDREVQRRITDDALRLHFRCIK
jgi:hypothetical protein